MPEKEGVDGREPILARGYGMYTLSHCCLSSYIHVFHTFAGIPLSVRTPPSFGLGRSHSLTVLWILEISVLCRLTAMRIKKRKKSKERQLYIRLQISGSMRMAFFCVGLMMKCEEIGVKKDSADVLAIGL